MGAKNLNDGVIQPVVLLLTAIRLKRKVSTLALKPQVIFTGLTGIRESLLYVSRAHLIRLHDKIKCLIESLTPLLTQHIQVSIRLEIFFLKRPTSKRQKYTLVQSSPLHNDIIISFQKLLLFRSRIFKNLKIVHATKVKITDIYIKSFKS